PEARRPARCRRAAAGDPALSLNPFPHPPTRSPPTMKRLVRCALRPAGALASTAGALAADLKVGLSVSLSGPNSSLGVPYAKGMQAAVAYKPEINGRKVQLIVLDDGSDPSNAGRHTRKLVEEEKVDILMGASGVPATIAISQVGRESKTPMVGLSPISLPPAERAWTVPAR